MCVRGSQVSKDECTMNKFIRIISTLLDLSIGMGYGKSHRPGKVLKGFTQEIQAYP